MRFKLIEKCAFASLKVTLLVLINVVSMKVSLKAFFDCAKKI